MIGDWIYDHLELMIVLIIALIIVLLSLSIRQENKEKEIACARMIALARTASDSILVIKDCDIPKHSNIIIVPTYIPSSK